MIKSHEQVMELRLPRIGIIRKGSPMTTGAKPSDTRPGKDLDHFRLDRAEQTVIKAWNETVGAEPKAISGILPYADPAENLNIWDELWQGKRLQWRGDGERLHVKLEGNAYVRYAPGEGPPQPAAAGEKVGSLKVARLSRLRILLPQLRIAGIFEIMSSSAIDADELWSNLMWIKSTVATLQGAPVTVFRAARQFNVPQADGKTMAVTKHMLHMMLDGRYIDALLPPPSAGILAPVTAAPALVSGAVEDDAPEFDDADYEDAPEATPPPATNGKPRAVQSEPPAEYDAGRVYVDGTPVHANLHTIYDEYVAAHDGHAPDAVAHLMNWKNKREREAKVAPKQTNGNTAASEQPAGQPALMSVENEPGNGAYEN